MYAYEVRASTNGKILTCDVYYKGNSPYLHHGAHIGTLTTTCHLCRSWATFGLLSALGGVALGLYGAILAFDPGSTGKKVGGWFALIAGAAALLTGLYLACYGGVRLDRWQRSDKIEKMVKEAVDSRVAGAMLEQRRIQAEMGVKTPLLANSDPNP